MAGAPGYDAVFPEIMALAEADPEREACGFVVADAGGELSVVAARNVAAAPRVAFEIDPALHLALARRLRGEGGRVAAVFHSHVDGPAELSRRDLERAMEDGAPLLPGVDQLVVGLRDGKAEEIRVFGWRADRWVPLAGMARRVAPGTPGAKSQPT